MGTAQIFLALYLYLICANVAVSQEECGVRRSLGKIVGGKDSGGYHYPWFALLVLKENSNSPICAGSLITPFYVLTAAHCFTINPSLPKESLFNVLIGVYNRCKSREPNRQLFGVQRVDINEDYDAKQKNHDIALMKLEREAHYTVICLPEPDRADSTEPATVVGFGVTRQGSRRAPCRMMEAEVTKYSKIECQRTDLPSADKEEPTVICAGAIRGGVDSCQGDSGGPLQIANAAGKYVIIGIVSYGYGCAQPGLPGLYTDVSKFISWIRGKISDDLVTQSNSSYVRFSREEIPSITISGNFPEGPPNYRVDQRRCCSSVSYENVDGITIRSTGVVFPND